MTARQKSADLARAFSGLPPESLRNLCKSTMLVEPLVQARVDLYIHGADQHGSKGKIQCQSKTSSSLSQPVQALPHVATRSASKPLVAAQSARVPQHLQVAALFRAQRLAQVPTFLPARPAQCAATDLTRAVTACANLLNIRHNCPAQPVLMRGFSVPSRPKRTAHVQ